MPNHILMLISDLAKNIYYKNGIFFRLKLISGSAGGPGVLVNKLWSQVLPLQQIDLRNVVAIQQEVSIKNRYNLG